MVNLKQDVPLKQSGYICLGSAATDYNANVPLYRVRTASIRAY
jgi:hypothetical protein